MRWIGFWKSITHSLNLLNWMNVILDGFCYFVTNLYFPNKISK